MKKVLLVLALVMSCMLASAQGYWKLESDIDDYTMEESYTLVHYLDGKIDAFYYEDLGVLNVIKKYGTPYLSKAIDAAVYHNGKIEDNVTTIYCRLINTASDYEEFELENQKIMFKGYEDDGKIGVDGFYSYYFIKCGADQLKKANFISFQYYDPISEQTVTKRISLAGFTKCYNQIKR